MKLNGDIPKHPVAEWIRFISAVLIVPLFAFMLGWQLSHERRLTVIESSSFTATDGLAVWMELGNKIDSINVPSAEVLNRLDSIEKSIQDIQRRIDELLLQRKGSNKWEPSPHVLPPGDLTWTYDMPAARLTADNLLPGENGYVSCAVNCCPEHHPCAWDGTPADDTPVGGTRVGCCTRADIAVKYGRASLEQAQRAMAQLEAANCRHDDCEASMRTLESLSATLEDMLELVGEPGE
jgi:hypothetical protein